MIPKTFSGFRAVAFALLLALVCSIPASAALQVQQLIGFGAGGGTGAKVLTWKGSSTSTSDLTTYTFSSADIGVASSDRYVIVAVTGGPNNRTVSSLTVGGVSATLVVEQVSAAASYTVSMWIANVTSGTTGDIVVTWSAGQTRTGIGWWTATGLSSGTANDSGGSTASPGTDTLNVLEGGFAVAAIVNIETGTDTVTWTNLTEKYDELYESVNQSGASDATTAGTLVITATYSSSGSNNNAFVAASW